MTLEIKTTADADALRHLFTKASERWAELTANSEVVVSSRTGGAWRLRRIADTSNFIIEQLADKVTG